MREGERMEGGGRREAEREGGRERGREGGKDIEREGTIWRGREREGEREGGRKEWVTLPFVCPIGQEGGSAVVGGGARWDHSVVQ